MEKLKISLHPHQLKKLSSGKTFQVGYDQMMHGEGIHKMDLLMPAIHVKKIMDNLQKGQGFRIHPDMVGGDLKSSLVTLAKDAGKVIKKGITNDLLSSTLQAGAMAAASAYGVPQAGVAAGPIIDSLVRHDWQAKGKNPKEIAQATLQDIKGQVSQHVQNTVHDGVAHAQHQAHHYAHQMASPYVDQYQHHYGQLHGMYNNAHNAYGQMHGMYQQHPMHSAYAGMQGGLNQFGGLSQYSGYTAPYPTTSMLGYGLVHDDLMKSGSKRVGYKTAMKKALRKHAKRDEDAEKEKLKAKYEEFLERKKRMKDMKDVKLMEKHAEKEMSDDAKLAQQLMGGSGLKRKRGRPRKEEYEEGGSILSSLKSVGSKIGNVLKRKDTQNALATAGISTGIDMLTGTPVGTLAAPGISMGLHQVGLGLRRKRGRPRKEGGSVLSSLKSVGNQIKNAFTNKSTQNALATGAISTGLDAVTGMPIGTLASPLISSGLSQVGLGLPKRMKVVGGQLRHGVPQPIISEHTKAQLRGINTRTLVGGSFLPLGNS